MLVQQRIQFNFFCLLTQLQMQLFFVGSLGLLMVLFSLFSLSSLSLSLSLTHTHAYTGSYITTTHGFSETTPLAPILRRRSLVSSHLISSHITHPTYRAWTDSLNFVGHKKPIVCSVIFLFKEKTLSSHTPSSLKQKYNPRLFSKKVKKKERSVCFCAIGSLGMLCFPLLVYLSLTHTHHKRTQTNKIMASAYGPRHRRVLWSCCSNCLTRACAIYRGVTTDTPSWLALAVQTRFFFLSLLACSSDDGGVCVYV